MQLIRVTSTPIKYEYNVERARLAYTTDLGGFTLQKQGGSLQVHTTHVSHQMDNSAMWRQLDHPGFRDRLAKEKSEATAAASEAIVKYVETGNQMANAHKGATIPEIMYQRLMQDKNAGSLMLSKLALPQFNWNPGSVEMSYQPVEQTFDWRTAKASMEFLPGSFSVNILQYPDIQIEYLGGPVYVPPSANPNYDGR